MRSQLLLLPIALLPFLSAPGGEECRKAAARAQQEEPAIPSYEDEHARFVFFAVLEGLYEDGVPNEVVDVIAETDPKSGWPRNFVYACPICTPALDALRVYRARPLFFGRKTQEDTYGHGLPEALTQRLLARDRGVRLSAVEEVVKSWLHRRVELLRFTEKERAEWAEAYALRRKLGMQQLEAYRASGVGPADYAVMKSCAFCDAANGACSVR